MVVGGCLTQITALIAHLISIHSLMLFPLGTIKRQVSLGFSYFPTTATK